MHLHVVGLRPPAQPRGRSSGARHTRIGWLQAHRREVLASGLQAPTGGVKSDVTYKHVLLPLTGSASSFSCQQVCGVIQVADEGAARA